MIREYFFGFDLRLWVCEGNGMIVEEMFECVFV